MTQLQVAPAKVRRSPYHNMIEPLARGHDPRHIEAFMRVKHSTLDGLYPNEFRAEVKLAIQCIMAEPDFAEDLARSYGF